MAVRRRSGRRPEHKELGLRGSVKMMWRLMVHGDLRRSVMGHGRIFRRAAGILGYAYLVGVKRQLRV